MALTHVVSYTSVDHIQDILPMIGSVTTLTSTQIFKFAAAAESLINAKISKNYAIPITQDVPVLQSLATDISIYYILTKRLFTSQQLEDSPWPDRYKEAMKTIDEIADGKTLLLNSSGTLIGARTDVAEVYSTSMNRIPTFWEGPMEDQIQDIEKIEDEANRRNITIRDKVL